MADSNRLVIISKGRGPRFESKFFSDIQKAILDGWRIADNGKRKDASMRNFKGRFGRAIFYKEGDPALHSEEEVKPVGVKPVKETSDTEAEKVVEREEEVGEDEVSLSEALQAADNRKELVELAEKHSLEVNDKLKNPEALRKSLISQAEG